MEQNATPQRHIAGIRNPQSLCAKPVAAFYLITNFNFQAYNKKFHRLQNPHRFIKSGRTDLHLKLLAQDFGR